MSSEPRTLESWLPVPPDSHFGIYNIPFGIISTPTDPTPRPATAIGTKALDLAVFAANGGFAAIPGFKTAVFTTESTLNAFAALGRNKVAAVREHLQEVLQVNSQYPGVLMRNPALQSICLHELSTATMHLPLAVGDYSDFYAGRNHAYNVGVLFRGRDNALQANYEHMPVGYHGRASSVVVSGTEVRRPRGQVVDLKAVKTPVVRACAKLDYEVELAAFVARDSCMGECVGVDEAGEYLFGVVLMNDWSARDIQAWEYVPLGPFTSKSFATSISPWVVMMDALEPYRTRPLQRASTVPLSPYLQEKEQDSVYDINLTVTLNTASGKSQILCKTSSSNLLFSFPQMLAHHTITGCPLRTGDLLGTGTISGTDIGSLGSLLEATENGARPLEIQGEQRTFVEDGDEVVIEGVCAPGVGFGEVRGRVLPAWGV